MDQVPSLQELRLLVRQGLHGPAVTAACGILRGTGGVDSARNGVAAKLVSESKAVQRAADVFRGQGDRASLDGLVADVTDRTVWTSVHATRFGYEWTCDVAYALCMRAALLGMQRQNDWQAEMCEDVIAAIALLAPLAYHSRDRGRQAPLDLRIDMTADGRARELTADVASMASELTRRVCRCAYEALPDEARSYAISVQHNVCELLGQPDRVLNS